MALALKTPPAKEPVKLEDVKQHCRIDITDDNNLVAALLLAARNTAEEYTRRAFITQVWELYLDELPDEDYISLPKPKLQSVELFQYQNPAGTWVTWDPANYIVDVNSTKGRIIAVNGWPSTVVKANGFRITFTSGYGLDGSTVPEPINQAIKMTVSHLYENRGGFVQGVSANQMLDAVQALLDPYRVLEI